ncbi:MAG: GNAT family N-acetyltransferase [Saprospiraceae bacterium]|nr:GNAT family N-acetyltransferase [Saprospiraceae bacterium]MDW8229294.1 GNAT family N-acetyltransferase [Saprospiraceae bacterium]
MTSEQGGQRAYREFCASQPVPLSHQPWWLDAVCGPIEWGAAVVEGGVWPYFQAHRWGVPVVQLPPYTTYAGPWLAPMPERWPSHKRLRQEQRLLEALAVQLPRVCFFRQNCLPEFANGLPLVWAGFRLTTRYTYKMAAGQAVEDAYARLKNTLRTDLRHAEQEVAIETTFDARRLFALYRASLRHRGLRRPQAPFERLVAALQERQQGVGWIARCRHSGADVAGLLLAFDEQRAAVVAAGRIYDGAHSGALHHLYWEAIGFCLQRALALDFEGSMAPGIERVFRAFGAQPEPYLQITRPAWAWL